MKLIPIFAFYCSAVLLAAPATWAAYFETSVPPEPGDHYRSAHYRLWLPPSTATIRGIVIRQHGCGEGATRYGLTHANDLQWQALAQKHGMALMGTELRVEEMCAQWFNVDGGTGRALLKALAAFAEDTAHAELNTAPWALFGHSGGAFWATGILFKHPERILAVIARSGGYPFMEWSPAAKKVPVLMAAGIDDRVDNLEYSTVMTTKSFLAYRRFGSPWTVIIDPKGDHGNVDGRRFYLPYLDALLSLRLPDTGTTPNPIDATRGWEGDPKTFKIQPITGKAQRGWAWLPTEKLARQWQEFVQTGTVTDSTRPTAPFALQLSGAGSEPRTLRWESDVDFESGLKSFRIFKNDSLVGSVGGQHSNHGDAPEPAVVAFEYKIEDFDSEARYIVTAVNHADLESLPSEAAR